MFILSRIYKIKGGSKLDKEIANDLFIILID